MIRRRIVVSGPPAAGKTTLATALADALGLPLIRKDDIKETLVDALGDRAGDLAWSRTLGGAATRGLWRMAERCPEAVLEANFRPHSQYERDRLSGLAGRLIEVHCHCPPDELIRRFAERARTAHPAHPLKELSPELLAEYDGPMGIGAVIEVDTSRPVDLAKVIARLGGLGW